MTPADPCINICLIDPRSGWCQGCKRTAAEVAAWPRLSLQERQALLAALALRWGAAFSGGGR